MTNRITRILARDLNSGFRSKFLIVTAIILIALVAVARIKFLGIERSGFYSLLTLTIAVIVSSFPGIWFGMISLSKKGRGDYIRPDSQEMTKEFFIARSVCVFILSLILLLFFNIASDPVPTEGWIRMLAVSLLLAYQAVITYLFIAILSKNEREGVKMTLVYGVFLIAAPVGIVLNSPWNVFFFYSPYYWISWVWLTEVPGQAIIYTAMASVINVIILIGLFFRSGMKRKTLG